MDSIMQLLAFSVSFACFLFACHLWTLRTTPRTTPTVLAASFFVLSAQMALLVVALEYGHDHWWMLMRPTLAMTFGPMAWLYFTSAANAEFKIRFRHILHFVPALFVGAEMALQTILIEIDYAIIASFTAYAAMLGWKTRLGMAQFSHLGDDAALVFRWLLVTAIILAVSSAGELAIFLGVQSGRGMSQSPALLVLLCIDFFLIGHALLAALRRPSLFDWMYELPNKTFDRKQGTYQDVDYQACIERLTVLMREEKLYAQEGATVQVVAKKLGVPPRLLSEAINRKFGESYSRHMNRQRVMVAQQLLHEHMSLPITQIMFEAGFRTKSSFNREFRAVAGETPSDYRRRTQ